MRRALVDTNVLLDVLSEREPFYPSSAAVWAMAETGKITAAISAISFNNIFYIVNRFADPATARNAVSALRDVFEVMPVNGQIINQAVDDPDMQDFEDAIQFYSAIHAEATHLITRNCSDFPAQTGLSILTPDEFLALLE